MSLHKGRSTKIRLNEAKYVRNIVPSYHILTVLAWIEAYSSTRTLICKLYMLLFPVGWMAWERFRCNIDCKNDPENCIR